MQLLTFDTRELRQVIDNHLTRVYVIIDERFTFECSITTKDRHPC